jgi:hypothetical protein
MSQKNIEVWKFLGEPTQSREAFDAAWAIQTEGPGFDAMLPTPARMRGVAHQ